MGNASFHLGLVLDVQMLRTLRKDFIEKEKEHKKRVSEKEVMQRKDTKKDYRRQNSETLDGS